MKVSVVIPVFNGENYIDHSIKSCLIQDEVGEIIVIDDGSLDSTCEIVQKLGNLDQRIILKKLDKNYGSSKARNIGIDLSNCELISFLDADDYFLPNRFAKGINCLKKYPEIQGTYEPIKIF
ncbi:MAG: glycosyltransferase family 2 protein [Saprospiraceae bacterium]|nr:glycosyltransferase family 2 protein [Saprospiraceae bacterium]